MLSIPFHAQSGFMLEGDSHAVCFIVPFATEARLNFTEELPFDRIREVTEQYGLIDQPKDLIRFTCI